MGNYKIWRGFHKAPVKSFTNADEALGYLVAYTHCVGGACIMLSPPEANKISAYAERTGFGKVSVEVFGSASDAEQRVTGYELNQLKENEAYRVRLEG